MRFIIPEGREKFYQWDVAQRLRCVDLAAGVEIHFSTPLSEGQDALVVKSYEEAGEVWVDVPNELLCHAGTLTLYAYPQAGEEGHTAYEVTFPILSREKPGDYIYTPEELHRWETLEQRLAELEEHGVPSADVTRAVELHNEDGEAHSDLRGMIGDKLDADQLDGAITTALAQAKESGAFDGVSPTVAVTDITGGHQVTITDVNGAKSFPVMDGLSGDGTTPGVSSWNDLTDKPFYAEVVETVLLPETTVTFVWSSNDSMWVFEMTPTAEQLAAWYGNWETAVVTWDGVNWPVTAQEVYGIKVIGDVGLMTGSGSTGEPFVMMLGGAEVYGADVCMIYSLADAAPEDTENAGTVEHTLAITAPVETVHPLDPKFIGAVSWEKVTEKPFGVYAAGETVLAEGQKITLPYNESEGLCFAYAPPLAWVDGVNAYRVTWCGETYTTAMGTVAMSGDTMKYIGNGAFMTSEFTDTGEPFFIGTIYTADGVASATMFVSNATESFTAAYSIVNAEEYIKTIEPEFLPDDTPELPTVTAEDNGKVLTVTEGVWAATEVEPELPAVTTDDNDKLLQVVDGAWQSVTLADSAVATYIDNYINEALGGEY